MRAHSTSVHLPCQNRSYTRERT
uniref:Uncharacterized protein n=1 Tax=Anguilla anguilla TaxID=7936 RepID=A0A0E9TTZ7_ANGAN